ncbi:MAG: metallophosphoesterase [Chlamydiales bacterium]|nr:metallophosphoesterase [Chlamydiales bacterium]
MKIWAISDLHLAFGIPSKTMEAFGSAWQGYTDRISLYWKQMVAPEDLVLIPGDISWAMRSEDALIDLLWIDALPGKKVILKGNHDYWWGSLSKVAKILPPSIQCIQNNALLFGSVAIGGSRLWDTEEYGFGPYITFRENPLSSKKLPINPEEAIAESERIFARELQRLEISLSQMDPHAKTRIALTHYPPVAADLTPSKTSQILEKHRVDYCIFGHLHNVKPQALPFGKARGVQYLFTSCDYIDFKPVLVTSVSPSTSKEPFLSN